MTTLQWNGRTRRYEGDRLVVTAEAYRSAVAAEVERARHAAHHQHQPFDEAAAHAAAETACLDEARWSPDDPGVDTVPAYLDGTVPAEAHQRPLRRYRFGPAPDRAFDHDGPLAGLDAEAIDGAAYGSRRAAALFAALGVDPDQDRYVLGALPDGRWGLHGPLAPEELFVVEAR